MFCGARTKKNGRCLAEPLPGKRRCHRHGGASTGPRTPEGKARRSACAREVALKQWQTDSFPKISDVGRIAVSEANRRPKSEAQRAKMSEAHRCVQAKRRVADGLKRIEAHGAAVSSIFAGVTEPYQGGAPEC